MRSAARQLRRAQRCRPDTHGMPAAKTSSHWHSEAFMGSRDSYINDLSLTKGFEHIERSLITELARRHAWRGEACRGYSTQSESSNLPEDQEGCWSCQTTERDPESLFCPSCGVIMPIDQQTSHHSLMSMKEGSYSIDLKLLERQYKRLQRQLHPDRFTRKSQTERGISEDASSRVNEAYVTLKDPLKRGQYLLDQQGLGAGEGVIEDPELLTTVMGAREAIEDTEDEQVLQKYNEIFDLQSKSCVQALAVAFEHGNMQKAQNLVTSLRYISNIQAAVLEKL